MKKQIWLGLLFAFTSTILFAQDKAMYEKHWFIKALDTLPYRLLLPKNYDPKKEYPLILFLHGSGERGNDNEAQLMHGWKLFLQDTIRENYPAIVVFPQCAASSYWSNVDFQYDSLTKKRTFVFPFDGEPTIAMQLLMQLLKDLNRKYKLDDDRLYVGGLSMGGMGTFELVKRKPKMFAAAFPICGGANAATAKKLKRTSWWIFHGLKDDVVSPQFSQQMADAIKATGAEVKLKLYPNANHNSWDSAFAEKELFPWLFSHKK
ncbi:MAG: phospholipase [Chitinophagaceae bacterium]|nr:MAG: phospholipase [Chitinophagaceae bacterium]